MIRNNPSEIWYYGKPPVGNHPKCQAYMVAYAQGGGLQVVRPHSGSLILSQNPLVIPAETCRI